MTGMLHGHDKLKKEIIKPKKIRIKEDKPTPEQEKRMADEVQKIIRGES